MHSLDADHARTLLTRSEELLVSIRINKTATVAKVLRKAKEGGFVQDLCTAGLKQRGRWLDAARDLPDYPLLLKIGREKKIPMIEAIVLARDAHFRLMLDAGLDVNGELLAKSGPLEAAVRASKPDMMRLLVEECAVDLNAKNPLWQTPLFAALEVRNADALNYLLDKGADVNAVDSFGNTPLAFFLGDKQLRLLDREFLEALLQHGADVNRQHTQSQLAPLHIILANSFAPTNVKTAAVAMLLERRADPDAADADQRVPLHYACGSGKLCDVIQKVRCELVQLLLKYGADANRQDENYNTPLHAATSADLAKVVELLAANGANPRLRNVDGLRACDLEVRSKGLDMVLAEALVKWEQAEQVATAAASDSLTTGQNNNTDTITNTSSTQEDRDINLNTGADNGRNLLSFREVARHLQVSSDRFRTSINRVEDAIAQLELMNVASSKQSHLETVDEDFDEVDGAVPFVAKPPVVEDTVVASKENLDILKLEFFKLKSLAYSFQCDYKKVVKDLKLHRNCKADFDIPESPDDDIIFRLGKNEDPKSTQTNGSLFDPSQLPKPTHDERNLAKACHVASSLLGHDWKSLLRELQSDDLIQTEVIIKEIESKYPGQLREQAYQALLHWKTNSGGRARYNHLVDAVDACCLGAVQKRLEQAFTEDSHS